MSNVPKVSLIYVIQVIVGGLSLARVCVVSHTQKQRERCAQMHILRGSEDCLSLSISGCMFDTIDTHVPKKDHQRSPELYICDTLGTLLSN